MGINANSGADDGHQMDSMITDAAMSLSLWSGRLRKRGASTVDSMHDSTNTLSPYSLRARRSVSASIGAVLSLLSMND